MTQPSLGDWFPLDADTIRTAFIKAKGFRLNVDQSLGHRRVIYRPHLSTKTTKVFTVWGDKGVYQVWLRPYTSPWTAACSRGGVHDNQREGAACSHGLSAAVAWLRERQAVSA